MTVMQQIQQATTVQELRDLFYRAETAEEQAEICRLEAELMGGPFWRQCACCAKDRATYRVMSFGIEVWACEECRTPCEYGEI